MRNEVLMPDWSIRGLCVDEDPEIFFPSGDGRRAQPQIEMARSICGQCPVQVNCLAFAVQSNAEYGIWAGTTAKERTRFRWQAEIARSARAVVVGNPKVEVKQQ